MAVDGSAFLITEGNWSFQESDQETSDKLVVSYGVKVTLLEDGPIVASGASGLPAIDSTYSAGNDSQSSLILKRRVWRRPESKTGLWVCDCHYETPRQDEAGEPSNDPTTWNPIKRVYTSQRQKEVTEARFVRFSNGIDFHALRSPTSRADEQKEGLIISSSGVPFRPAPLMDDSRLNVSVARYYKSLNINFYAKYRNAINSDTFKIQKLDIANNQNILWELNIQPGQAKMVGIGLDELERNNETFLRLHLEIAIDEDGWDITVPDVAQSARSCPPDDTDWPHGGDPDGLGGTIDAVNVVVGTSRSRQIFDALGNSLNEMVQLDGTGQPLTCGADPVNMTWEVYEKLPFALLGL